MEKIWIIHCTIIQSILYITFHIIKSYLSVPSKDDDQRKFESKTANAKPVIIPLWPEKLTKSILQWYHINSLLGGGGL